MNRNNMIIDIAQDFSDEDKRRAEKILELAWKVDNYIDNKFKTEHTELYNKWHGNHCIQTAVMICGILNEIQSIYPQVVYAIMEDKHEGKTIHYNHAYVHAVDELPYRSIKHYAIDMPRNDRQQLFVAGDTSIDVECESTFDYQGYEDIKILQTQDMDFKKLILFEVEYFTNKPSYYLFKEIKDKFRNEIDELNKGEA